jgi:GNAT superfamily N-acetyltransferase
MYLEDILVTEQMRGKKIGQLLFDQLIKEAAERNPNVQALPTPQPADIPR